MELQTKTITAKTVKIGSQNFVLAAGEKLEIKNSQTILDETVPAGKQWNVHLSISLEETNI